jgi:GxxExxY protein
VDLGRSRIILELKAVGSELGAAEVQQLKNYMRHLRIPLGLLINFQQPKTQEGKTELEIKEVAL